nr:reverse transcriptase domain-containing protein [Tanacetum cinerariifolium]
MEYDYKPAVQSQRRVNPKIHDVIKKEVIKLFDAVMIYPISDSPWVSTIHCLPKKGGYFQIPIDPQDQKKLLSHALMEPSRTDACPLSFVMLQPDQSELTSIVDSEIRKNVPSTTNVNLPPEEDHSPLFAYVVWIFLSFLTYLVVPPNLFSFGNEDTIFDPGIVNYHFPSLLPDVAHRCETFMKFNVYPKLLNEILMEILSSSCSPMEQ